MVLGYSLLRAYVAEHIQLLLVFSTHTSFLSGCAVETRAFRGTESASNRVFPQPVRSHFPPPATFALLRSRVSSPVCFPCPRSNTSSQRQSSCPSLSRLPQQTIRHALGESQSPASVRRTHTLPNSPCSFRSSVG